jgi:hypothetical protein
MYIAPYVCIIGGVNSKLVMGDFSGVAAGSKLFVVVMILLRDDKPTNTFRI